MCGIFIIKHNQNQKKYFGKFKASLEDLYPRGPDKTEYLKKKNYLIGFTRLSINDLKIAHQPYQGENKRYTVVFNGEILNYKKLITNFEKKIKFKQHTETEVILKLYILFGEKFIKLLRGFFAIIIIDHKIDKIFACVDQYSVKPIYYYYDKNLTIISSNLTPIIKNNLVKKEYNYKEIINFISLGREINNKTIFKNINKVTASTFITIYKKKLIKKRYWSPFEKKNSKNFSDEDYSKKISCQFDNVVNIWKTSDVPLSNTRSTGTDSNIINYYFKKNNTYIKNFLTKEKKNQKINRDDNIVKFNKNDVEKDFNNFIKNNIDPLSIAVSSNLTLFNLYKNIQKKKYKVSFTGEGADEMFGGYTKYLRHLKLIKKRKGDLYSSFLDLYKKEINLTNEILKKRNENIFDDLKKNIKTIRINSKTNLNKILEFDQKTWVPTLMKCHDSIGMFYSLEIRPLYLDQKLINLSNNLPEHLKIYKKCQKIILNKLLFEKFKYKVEKNKIGTPTFFSSIINKKKNKTEFKKNLFNGPISKIIDANKTWNICNRQFKMKDPIFLWRLYILTKILT